MPTRVKTITEYHRLRGLPEPGHPLISVVNTKGFTASGQAVQMLMDFYCIMLKNNPQFKFKYGQLDCDFDNGVLFFLAPGQILGIDAGANRPAEAPSGWLLLVHPDFLWGTSLAKKIKQYAFFDYAVHEALFLSEKEETSISDIIQRIGQECTASIDKFTQDIIVAQIELLLAYSERFYQRQFITRHIPNHQILERLEAVLSSYFDRDDAGDGLPTVQYLADQLNISPNYLSSLLKVLTGRNAQQHIHDKVVEKAKEMLSTTTLAVNEIAYHLGFEYPQSFTRLFKSKTALSPSAFRQSFR